MSINSSVLYLSLPSKHVHAIHNIIVKQIDDLKLSQPFTIGFAKIGEKFDLNINKCRTAECDILNHHSNKEYELLFDQNLHIILKLITRQQLEFGALSFDSAENLAFDLKKLASNIISEKNVKLIYAKSYPQFAFEYCLMLYAQSLGIRFVFDGFIPYFNRTLLQECEVKNGIFNIYSIKPKSYHLISPASSHISLKSIENVLDKIVSIHSQSAIVPGNDTYIPFASHISESNKNNFFGTIVASLRELLSWLMSCDKNTKNEYYLKFRVKNSAKKYIARRVSLMDAFFIKPISSLMSAKRLYSALKSSVSIKSECDDLDVIYFASQEPEATILVNGGMFNTNIAAIDYLRSYFHPDITIGYKEAMSAFLPNTFDGVCTEPENKNPTIYNRIKDLRNVDVLGEISKSNLFKTDKIYSTICGTIGFEASLMGQRVLLFSGQWYSESRHPNLQYVGEWDCSSALLSRDESKEYWAHFLYEYLLCSVPLCIDGILYSIDRTTVEYLNNMTCQLSGVFD